ncbi:hypothetical protein [Alcanivorax sp. 1008]|uniref:hypothetical protein n=1 Tax=Alcanivorax sp. 1008 TaxID=2816853 RepID=UPI001DFA44D7|nr:hypothetical protein [Alcanivorax sp. 1008]MCC1497748.1 hypothetical protein [Alcanivorax sp. 1008]
MVHILLLLTVLIAALVLLANSWKAEKRLFAATALVIVLTAGGIIGVLGLQLLKPPALLDPSQISITLDSARVVESGVRIAGQLHNLSAERVSAVRLKVTALTCAEDDCRELGQKQINVVMQIPPGNSYPFSTVAPIIGLPDNTELSWLVEPVKITVY